MRLVLWMLLAISGPAHADSKFVPLFSNGWFRFEKIDEFTDKAEVFVSKESEDTPDCQSVNDEKARLIVRCENDTTALLLQTGCYIGALRAPYNQIMMRVDDNPAFTVKFDQATDHEVIGLFSGGRSIPVIRDHLIDGGTLAIRFTPVGDSPTSVHFDLDGLGPQVEVIRESCEW